MLRPWQRFETSESLIAGLAQKVDGKNEIFSIQSDPLTASLVSCLGLQFELGNPTLDRTSFLLGVNFSEKKSNPWNCEIITYQGMIGLRAWLESKREFSPLHEDFANILHPLSISNNELNQIFIFPSHVASKYAQRGIELVIVRDWALSAFLGSNLKLNYQRTNRYEIEENIALTQMRLLENRQLAFTGTHDLGDHLLGANIDGIAKCDSLLSEIKKKYFAIFNSKKSNLRHLVLSYLIAVMLDDLAQPQWYGSEPHFEACYRALRSMDRTQNQKDLQEIFLPKSFHSLVAGIRNRASSSNENEVRFQQFFADLK